MTTANVSRQALMFLARREGLKNWATRLPPLRHVAERFIAGETAAQALQALRGLTDQGFTASFDHLNEEVQDVAETHAEVGTYAELLGLIRSEGLDDKVNVSIKLSQLGLGMSHALALANARQVVSAARAQGNFVRVDMEGSALTDEILNVFRSLREEFGRDHVGAVMQAALRRTEADVKALLTLPARIRLCKGAYLESDAVAFSRKSEVDANFVSLMQRLLDSGTYHGIATHDPRMIDETLAYAAKQRLPRNAFEFQMLYGVRRDLQRTLLAAGHPVRIYVPYGRHWYPYFMRRLAERPANVWFVLKTLMQS